MPDFVYVGTKPETIVGLSPKNISEAEYDALPWELQQAVINNRGSDGTPLYQERPSRAERKRVRDLMGPDTGSADDSGSDDADSATDTPVADDSGRIAPTADAPAPTDPSAQPPAEPDLNQPLDEPAKGDT